MTVGVVTLDAGFCQPLLFPMGEGVVFTLPDDSGLGKLALPKMGSPDQRQPHPQPSPSAIRRFEAAMAADFKVPSSIAEDLGAGSVNDVSKSEPQAKNCEDRIPIGLSIGTEPHIIAASHKMGWNLQSIAEPISDFGHESQSAKIKVTLPSANNVTGNPVNTASSEKQPAVVIVRSFASAEKPGLAVPKPICVDVPVVSSSARTIVISRNTNTVTVDRAPEATVEKSVSVAPARASRTTSKFVVDSGPHVNHINDVAQPASAIRPPSKSSGEIGGVIEKFARVHVEKPISASDGSLPVEKPGAASADALFVKKHTVVPVVGESLSKPVERQDVPAANLRPTTVNAAKVILRVPADKPAIAVIGNRETSTIAEVRSNPPAAIESPVGAAKSYEGGARLNLVSGATHAQAEKAVVESLKRSGASAIVAEAGPTVAVEKQAITTPEPPLRVAPASLPSSTAVVPERLVATIEVENPPVDRIAVAPIERHVFVEEEAFAADVFTVSPIEKPVVSALEQTGTIVAGDAVVSEKKQETLVSAEKPIVVAEGKMVTVAPMAVPPSATAIADNVASLDKPVVVNQPDSANVAKAVVVGVDNQEVKTVIASAPQGKPEVTVRRPVEIIVEGPAVVPVSEKLVAGTVAVSQPDSGNAAKAVVVGADNQEVKTVIASAPHGKPEVTAQRPVEIIVEGPAVVPVSEKLVAGTVAVSQPDPENAAKAVVVGADTQEVKTVIAPVPHGKPEVVVQRPVEIIVERPAVVPVSEKLVAGTVAVSQPDPENAAKAVVVGADTQEVKAVIAPVPQGKPEDVVQRPVEIIVEGPAVVPVSEKFVAETVVRTNAPIAESQTVASVARNASSIVGFVPQAPTETVVVVEKPIGASVGRPVLAAVTAGKENTVGVSMERREASMPTMRETLGGIDEKSTALFVEKPVIVASPAVIHGAASDVKANSVATVNYVESEDAPSVVSGVMSSPTVESVGHSVAYAAGDMVIPPVVAEKPSVMPLDDTAPVKTVVDVARKVDKTEEKTLAAAEHVVVPVAGEVPAPQTVQAAPEVAAASAAQARTAAIVETVNQIVEAVVGQILVMPGAAYGECEVKIMLKPTVLDGSEITMSAKDGVLAVSVTPATQEAAATAMAALPRLETALAEHAPAFHHVSVALALKKGRIDETV